MPNRKIAIVGGGITGLYCAYILKKNDCDVHLFEETDRIGGRIRTIRLTENGNTIDPTQFNSGLPDELAFHAEFGPMRVAPFEHRLLQKLLKELGFWDPQDDKVTGVSTGPQQLRLEDFPPYSSPMDSKAPKYELRADELGKTPLNLLQLAIRRIMLQVSLKSETKTTDPASNNTFNGIMRKFKNWQKHLRENLELAEKTGEDPTPYFLESVRRLQKLPSVIWAIQTHGVVEMYFDQDDQREEIHLYTLGFWNLLSGFLSHEAVEEVRNIGTFYHLMPDNPNAAEWLAWWLSGLAISDQLKGFEAGTEMLIERLKQKFKDCTTSKDEPIHLQKRILEIHRMKDTSDSQITIFLRDQKTGEESHFLETSEGGAQTPEHATKFDHVILALPKEPLQKLILRSADQFKMPQTKLEELMDSSYGFPLVKVFFLVKRRWWARDTQPNESASRIPTRELHRYETKLKVRFIRDAKRPEIVENKRGMIMLYTDRPASAFWGNFVPSGRHTDVREWRRGDTPETDEFNQWARLRKKIVRYFRQFAGPSFREDDILWIGIRDWSRDPYAGGNHAWRPKRRYWHVMKELAGLKLKSSQANADTNTDKGSVHVCGEAYSDYHGFIEGALRSSILVLSRILGGPGGKPANLAGDAKTSLTWLSEKANLCPTEGAREYLDEWLLALEADKGGLYHWDSSKDEALRQ